MKREEGGTEKERIKIKKEMIDKDREEKGGEEEGESLWHSCSND
jgi:hypothetical protein